MTNGAANLPAGAVRCAEDEFLQPASGGGGASCRGCHDACSYGQHCVRHGARAGCRNCTEGFFDDDLDTTTPCAECPEGKDSEPGATECATSLAAEVEDDVTRASDFIEAAAALVGVIASVAGGICWLRRWSISGLKPQARPVVALLTTS